MATYYLLPKQWPFMAFPLLGYLFGKYIDRSESERLSLFRDKSALYGRVLKEGEKPTWP
ncbi:NADH dehydrogenase [ubiquinone] 1 beta subcomplex subunit 1 [Euwallacea fornicatus]|uniref:NADH dehydrogenase [ubiquinone] 1 beta subcomplex subunit 1 n=1 Tax=Euwallacea fornicatus TaxID=995702 RepID=UPI00338EE5A6